MRRADTPRLRPSDYASLFEAAVCLAAARVVIRVVPFRWLVRAWTRPVRRPALPEPARVRTIAAVRRAVLAAAAHLPGQTVCFPRAVAAQAMLRRRRVDTTLFYGATTAHEQRLQAHVWLSAGDVAVVGHEIASHYPVLVSYSSSVSAPT